MQLKTEVITAIKVNYEDLEALVKQLRPDAGYSFVASEEMDNGSTYEASSISAEQDPNGEHTKSYEAYLDGESDEEPMFATKSLLHVLVKRGLAPAGNYYISVWW